MTMLKSTRLRLEEERRFALGQRIDGGEWETLGWSCVEALLHLTYTRMSAEESEIHDQVRAAMREYRDAQRSQG